MLGFERSLLCRHPPRPVSLPPLITYTLSRHFCKATMVTTEQVMEVHHEACYVLRNAFVRVDTTVRGARMHAQSHSTAALTTRLCSSSSRC